MMSWPGVSVARPTAGNLHSHQQHQLHPLCSLFGRPVLQPASCCRGAWFSNQHQPLLPPKQAKHTHSAASSGVLSEPSQLMSGRVHMSMVYSVSCSSTVRTCVGGGVGCADGSHGQGLLLHASHGALSAQLLHCAHLQATQVCVANSGRQKRSLTGWHHQPLP